MKITQVYAPLLRDDIGLRLRATAAFEHVWFLARLWLRAQAARRELDRQDDRILADLGLSRAQADFELSRGPLAQLASQHRR